MKINNRTVQDSQLERSQGRQSERVGGSRTSDLQGSQRYQVGLDRVEVSNLADTAAQIISSAHQTRESHIVQLTALHQAGQIAVDPDQLANSILDHDLDAGIEER